MFNFKSGVRQALVWIGARKMKGRKFYWSGINPQMLVRIKGWHDFVQSALLRCKEADAITIKVEICKVEKCKNVCQLTILAHKNVGEYRETYSRHITSAPLYGNVVDEYEELGYDGGYCTDAGYIRWKNDDPIYVGWEFAELGIPRTTREYYCQTYY